MFNNSNKKMVIGGLILSLPMLASAGDLIISGSGVGNCQYDNFDVNSNGTLTLNLLDNGCLTGAGGSSSGGSSSGGSSSGGSSSGGSSSGGSSSGGSSSGGSSSGGSSSGGEVTVASDANAVYKYNNGYGSFSSKENLGPQTIASTGKTVYIVNQGGGDTSVPSCVNGKKVMQDCSPTGWNLGIKSNEIYALRLITGDNYSYGLMKTEQNTFSGGVTLQANYNYVISDKPGDMGSSPFEGACASTDVNSSGYLLLSPTLAGQYYCKVPKGKLIYINMELTNSDKNKCDAGKCDNYFTLSGFKLPTGLNN